MTNQIIDQGGNNEDGNSFDDVAVIGDKPISVQVMQHIYKEITGKTEKTGKSYNDDTFIELIDIIDLNHKFEQSIEQYDVRANTCSVHLYYSDDTNDQFSSFDRLKLHGNGSCASVESILIKYNLMVILPKAQKLQTYTISIRLMSRVAIEKKLESNFFPIHAKSIAMLGGKTAFIEIEYIDYAVAKNILRVFDEWHKSLKRSDKNSVMENLQKYSHWIPRAIGVITILVILISILQIMPHYIGASDANFLSFGKFAVIVTSIAYIIRLSAIWISQLTENYIDAWSKISYLKITKGDNIVIDEITKKNKKSLFVAFISLISSLAVSVGTKIFASVISSAVLSP